MVEPTRRLLLAALPVLAAAAPAARGFDFRFPGIEGGQIDLSAHRGKPVLVVNTASFCGFAPQFAALQKLHEAYAPRGLLLLGVPSNDFNQEAADNAAVKAFCDAEFGVDFPMAAISHVKGPEAHPFFAWAGAPGCDSDGSRLAFMQKGNSVFLLRNISPNPATPGLTPQPQYVGLASKFDVLDLNLAWDAELPSDFKLRTQGNFIHNLAYDKGEMLKRSEGEIVNNINSKGQFESGGNALMVQFTLGSALEMRKRGDWNVLAGYKYIQPDALPDGFNDSSFHLGGTNAKGYFIGGNYGIDKNIYASARWLSASEVYGAPFEVDVMQLELNTRF